jgi:hypothetical protein
LDISSGSPSRFWLHATHASRARAGTGISNPAHDTVSRRAAAGQTQAVGRHLAAFFFFPNPNLLLSCGGEEAGVMSEYDMTTMRIESSSVFFRRLSYALFIGWVVYGVYLFFIGDWWSVNLLMVFIAFAVSFIVYRTLEIIFDTR